MNKQTPILIMDEWIFLSDTIVYIVWYLFSLS